AFSAWKRGLVIDWQQFYQWLIPYYHHPKLSFFVIPDVVEGGEGNLAALFCQSAKRTKSLLFLPHREE
ncbi:hypothetical protein MJM43_30940, partial [Salmonella enterica subsp. enterica serovar Montevideo]|nr:hypothetical protein [Salmonella enterica subsp. enterica serovar Montevideo]